MFLVVALFLALPIHAGTYCIYNTFLTIHGAGPIPYCGNITVGTTCTYACQSQFYLDGPSTTLTTCTEDGLWPPYPSQYVQCRDWTKVCPPNTTDDGEPTQDHDRICQPDCEPYPDTENALPLSDDNCPRTLNSTCNLQCQDGYVLSDDKPIQCVTDLRGKTSKWNSTASCIKEAENYTCTTYPRGEHTRNPQNCGYALPGTLCSFGCEPGYVLNITGLINCTENGWDQQVGCIPVTCPPYLIDWASNFSDECIAGELYSICSFDCDNGTLLSDFSPLVCLPVSEGVAKWNKAPTCDAQNCSAYDLSHASNATCPGTLNSICSLVCDDGYTLSNDDGILCQGTRYGAKWNQTTTKCVTICDGDPSAPEDGAAGSCANTSHNFCVQTCNEGYFLSQGNLTRLCMPDGNYTVQTAQCTPVVCSGNETENTKSNCSQPATFGQYCVEDCDDGYTYVSGVGMRFCQSDGTYEPSTLMCAEIRCDALIVPSSPSHLAGNCTSESPYLGYCEEKCVDGFVLAPGSGDLRRECQGNGSYTLPTGLCVESNCAAYDVGVGATGIGADCFGAPVGSTCNFTCQSGYQLEGWNPKAPIVCTFSPQSSSTLALWNSSLRCAPVACRDDSPKVANVSNGNCSLASIFGDKCKQECVSNTYLFSGSLFRTCLTNGSLSFPSANCSGCQAEIEYFNPANSSCTRCPPNAHIKNASIPNYSSAACECDRGYKGGGALCVHSSTSDDREIRVQLQIDGPTTDPTTFLTEFKKDIAASLNISQDEIEDVQIVTGPNSTTVTFLLPNISTANDLLVQINDPNSTLYQGTVTKNINPSEVFFISAFVNAAISSVTQLSNTMLAVCIVIPVIALSICFCGCHWRYPKSNHRRVLFCLLGMGKMVIQVFFVLWLEDLGDECPEWIFMSAVASMILHVVVNVVVAYVLFSMIKRCDDPAWKEWLAKHPYVFYTSWFMASIRVQNGLIMKSFLLESEAFRAPLPWELRRKLIGGDLVPMVLSDFLMIICQTGISFALNNWNNVGLIGLIANLVYLSLLAFTRCRAFTSRERGKGLGNRAHEIMQEMVDLSRKSLGGSGRSHSTSSRTPRSPSSASYTSTPGPKEDP